MNLFKLIRVSVLSLTALMGLVSCAGGGGGAASDKQPSQDQDEEVQMGQEVFDQLKAKGEIIESSPLYQARKGRDWSIAPRREHRAKRTANARECAASHGLSFRRLQTSRSSSQRF
jgi:hypothetical protein